MSVNQSIDRTINKSNEGGLKLQHLQRRLADRLEVRLVNYQCTL